MKPKEELADRLSREIFSRSWGKLDLEEQFFIYRHVMWYGYYRERIAAAAREVMDTRKLSGKDYEIIYRWYIERDSLTDVLRAIEECGEYARANVKVIYSLNYFRRAVERHKEHSMRMSPPREYVEGEEEANWYYIGFNRWKGGKWPKWRYHPFIGPNPNMGILLEEKGVAGVTEG